MEKKKILVIDDEVDLLSILDKYLTDKGYAVSTCSSGQEGINKVREQVYDFIVVDIRMPGMNGLETIKNMLKINQNRAPFLIITGYAITEDVTAILRECKLVHGYLLKPFALNELKDKIQQILAKVKP